MKEIKLPVSILIIFLFLISLFSSVINAGNFSISETISPRDLDSKDIYLYNWTGCYDLHALDSVGSFGVYCHIPVVVDGQSPVVINNVWTEPYDKVVGFKVIDNYSGPNSLLEVNISGLSVNETVKLFWSISCIVRENNYTDLPDYIEKVPRGELPNDVRKWLFSSEFIQSDHWRIKLRSRLLRGFSYNVVKIAKCVADFTGNKIGDRGGYQYALYTLRTSGGNCMGKANLATALLRANGIPARVLMVYPTHYIIEYYVYPYGWIRLESDLGEMPYPNQYNSVVFCAYPEDETSLNIINGQHPGGGLIEYWGTSNSNVNIDVNWSDWSKNITSLFTTTLNVDGLLDMAKRCWNYYASYLGKNLSEVREGYFLNATKYQKTAVGCFEGRNLEGYIENITLSYSEYSKIEEKIKGITVGSDIVGDESSISEISTFIDDCDINMLIVDFGWITWSWNNTNFAKVSGLIDETRHKNISVWLMYRARTLPGDEYKLSHQIHRDGEVDEREICFSHKKCRNWSISWAKELVEKYPNVDGIILYNPRFLPDCCYCRLCVNKFRFESRTFGFPRFFIEGTEKYDKWMNWRVEEITEFIREWKDEITTYNPQIQTGAVLLPLQYGSFSMGQDLSKLGDILDIIFPFVVLNNVTDSNIAGQICNDTKDVVSCKIAAYIKIYGPYTNTDSDIVNAIKSSMNSQGNGFFIWCYDCLDPEKYDLEKIIDAYNCIYH